jgi:ABC-type phosphate/phosphonate transport system substrate-binding protein
VRDGLVDAAAIDSTVLALEARADPGLGELRVIARVGPAPSPPVVLANGTPQLRDALAAALVGLEPSDEGRAALDLGAIARFSPVTDADYDAVRELDRRRPRVAPAS